MKKLAIAILASTRGTTSQGIIDAIESGELNAEIKCFVSNKKDCGALEKAKSHGIETIFVDGKKFKERKEFDREVARILDEKGIELIVCSGYMRWFSKWFVEKYKWRILNDHPSLLPSFVGMDRNVHQDVMDHGCKVTGSTIFFVDESEDAGPIIMQQCVPIKENDSVDSLRERVQALQVEMYPKAVKLFAEGKLKVEGRRVKILGETE